LPRLYDPREIVTMDMLTPRFISPNLYSNLSRAVYLSVSGIWYSKK